jgi:hypothetical protein
MKPLVLTDEQRANAYVTYDTSKYCLYIKEGFGYVFMSSYSAKEDFKADMELNNIKPKMDHGASMKYLEQ